MKKKRILSIACILSLFLMAGCAGNEAGESSQQGNKASALAESAAEPVGESAGKAAGTDSSDAAAGTNSSDAAAGAESSDPAGADSSVVFFTSDISAEGLVKIYDTLGWTPTGNVAVKISTGEPPASNYLRPELIMIW